MKNKFRIPLIILGLYVLGSLICPRVPSQADPAAILRTAQAAESNASYTAKQLIVDNGKEQLLDIHKTPKSPAQNLIRLDIPCGFIPLIEGVDNIAGRKAWILRIKPKTDHTAWSHYWIDDKTGVVLAYRRWSAKDKMIQSMKTLSITFERKAESG